MKQCFRTFCFRMFYNSLADSLNLFLMNKRFALLLSILFILFVLQSEAKKHKMKKIKIGKTAKKVERALFHKKHKKHKKHKSKSSSTSLSVSMISPTATTFTNTFPTIPTSDVYFTYTDKNFNYFLGYPSGGPNGANYYQNPMLMVAQPTRKCGCCDNKLIIVTRAPDDRDLI